MYAYNLATAYNIIYMYTQGSFSNGWTLGRLTGYEDNFACWFDHLEESYSYKEAHFKSFAHCENQLHCPPSENFNEPLDTQSDLRTNLCNLHICT